MSSTQSAPNFDPINILAKSLLDLSAAVGDTSLTLQNVTGISVNDFIYFGNLNQGTTEKKKITAISGTLVTLDSAVLYPHQKFEEVTDVFGDQIEFYSAANVDGTVPVDASFSSLTTVSMVQNQLVTSYTDASGGSSTWYKFVYKNSFTGAVTDIADSVAARGSDYGHYCRVEDIRQEAGLNDVSQVTNIMIDLEREAAESYINGILRNSYQLPLVQPYPGIVSKVAIMLASGYVLSQQYSALTPNMSRLGSAKIEQATAILTQIQFREIVLMDILGNSLLLPNAIEGFPNGQTSSMPYCESGDDGPVIRISTRF